MKPDELVDDYERALLGALLTEPTDLPPLRPEEFFLERHCVIWTQMLKLAESGQKPDLILVQGALRQAGRLEEAGGRAYLAQLVEEGCLAMQVGGYAQAIRDAATSRGLRRFGLELAEGGASPDEVERALAAIPRPMTAKQFKILDVWRDLQAGWLAAPVRLHLAAVDRLLGGFVPGDLVVVGGRTSHGKSSLLVSAALSIGERDQVPVAYYTLETTKTGVLRRFIAARALVPLMALRSGALSPTQFQLADEVAGWLDTQPLVIRDVADLGTKTAARLCEALMVEPAPVVMLDHLQEVQTDDRESRAYALGQFLSRLKELALRRGKILLLAAQVSREGERRSGPPTLGDLKESGGIEEKADIVLLLYYAIKSGANCPPEELDVVVAKNRDGGTDKVKVHFQPQYGLVGNGSHG